ncbi:MAG: class I SAM-dependent methyltransferase [Candidatus Peribacteraceae bacterium]|nr:class I SAM-dependent methyltransferase [Candidatus Peribacteraceae bacterium]
MTTSSKYQKELDWLVPDPLNVSRWEKHATYQIIQKYTPYLTGAVADFGCNNAIACCMLSKLHGVETVTGFDISTKALADGEHVIKTHPNCWTNKISLIYSNLTNIDCGDNQFDSAISLHTLEHIYPEDLDAVLSEIARVLKPGGHFVFSVPCKRAFDDSEAHVVFFSIEDELKFTCLPTLLGRHGFSIIEIYNDTALGTGNNACITGLAQSLKL